MTRVYRKHGWQHDTDCRLVVSGPPTRVRLEVAPPVLPSVPEPGKSRGGKYRANPGSFRKSYLGKAVRWLKRHMTNRCR